jgi:acetyl-CoA carboxylase biotin carboxylase subunit
MVTGVDVVREQLRIAGGGLISVSQHGVTVRGHAIEARINAERPERNFMPTPGRLERWAAPIGTDIRVDTACFPGWIVVPYYDSMLAKIIAWGSDRAHAIARLLHALAHLRVDGVATTTAFARDVLAHPDVAQGGVHTRWIEDVFLPSWSPLEVAG